MTKNPGRYNLLQPRLCHLEIVRVALLSNPGEWIDAKKIADLLEVFYKFTCLFLSSNNPTSNLFFSKLMTILFTLQNNMKDNDFISTMANEMYKKFNKYWRKFGVILSIACIFDP